jgi:hypothetical protein
MRFLEDISRKSFLEDVTLTLANATALGRMLTCTYVLSV